MRVGERTGEESQLGGAVTGVEIARGAEGGAEGGLHGVMEMQGPGAARGGDAQTGYLGQC